MTIPENLQFHAGDRLRKARESRGLQVKELASMLGVDPSTIGKYENGRQEVRQHWAVLYEHTTGVQATWILTGDTEGGDETPPEKSILCSIDETMSLLGDLGRSKVNELLDDGKLESVQIGRRTFVVRESIETYVDGLARRVRSE